MPILWEMLYAGQDPSSLRHEEGVLKKDLNVRECTLTKVSPDLWQLLVKFGEGANGPCDSTLRKIVRLHPARVHYISPSGLYVKNESLYSPNPSPPPVTSREFYGGNLYPATDVVRRALFSSTAFLVGNATNIPLESNPSIVLDDWGAPRRRYSSYAHELYAQEFHEVFEGAEDRFAQELRTTSHSDLLHPEPEPLRPSQLFPFPYYWHDQLIVSKIYVPKEEVLKKSAHIKTVYPRKTRWERFSDDDD